MAKEAKEREVEVTDRAVKSMTKRVLECLDEKQTSKGQHMNRCRRINERMAEVYEGAAHEGIPQRIAKKHIKVIVLTEKLKAAVADLDAAEQALARKMAKAVGNKVQLALWADMPVLKVPKPKKEAAPKKRKGASGEDIAEAEAAAAATETAEDEYRPLH